MSWNILATPGTIAGIGAESADFLRKNSCKVTITEPFGAQSAADFQQLLPEIQAVYAGAAVDAFVEEPLPSEHPFRTAKNLLLAPHQAAFSNETGREVSAACAEAIVDLMNGERPKMVLNPEVFDSPQLRAKLN
jgi:hypothetical protein